MYSFRELQKASKLDIQGKEIKIAVLGNCATQFFSVAIKGCAKLSGMNVCVYDADYNQILEQLLDEESDLYKFNPDKIVLWLSTEKLYEEFLEIELSERKYFAEKYIDKIISYWNLINNNLSASIIQLNFVELADMVLGHYSAKIDITFIYQIRKLNYLLQQEMMNNNNVYPVDLSLLQARLGRDKLYDAPLYYNAQMPVSINALPYISQAIVDVIASMEGRLKKCIVLDLDNTLWGGVIGDDGIDNIEIGQLGRGHVFTEFQAWLKQLKECGIILAVCSKNDEANAKEPFEKHEDMVLRLSDIAVFVANWKDKATNIKYIQEVLKIGMDSIVFLDDNPFERNLVKEMLPEVIVPELPEDPALWLEYLHECNLFESVAYTGENSDRTSVYQQEFSRQKSKESFESIDDYLKDLDMKANVTPFEPDKYSRIAQLTQRSNQFNLRTIRYTENEIQRIAEDEGYLTLSVSMKDKFGSHGLISVVILRKQAEGLFVDTWLMSCRVLKRGVEEFIINKIMEIARSEGYEHVFGEYIPTVKNNMVKNIYKDVGFKEYEHNHYRIACASYKNRRTFVKEEMENE